MKLISDETQAKIIALQATFDLLSERIDRELKLLRELRADIDKAAEVKP